MLDQPRTSKSDFLRRGGEMAERIQRYDWSSTPIGAIDTWSQSLRTTVGLLLNNRFPMLLWWGDQYISIYNDAYIPVLGSKHPWGLGKPVRECWSEIWHILQPLIDAPYKGGESTWMEDFPLQINRNGYMEETHFTVAYSPVPDESKPSRIGGVLATVHEITEKVISERALTTLREIGTVALEDRSLDKIYHNVAQALGKNNKDFPFVLIYKITNDGKNVEVVSSAGIDKKQEVFPEKIDIFKPTDITKEFCLAFQQNKVVVSDIKAEDKSLPKGGWEEAPHQFVYLPISAAFGKHPYCIISAALNPFRKFDETFKQFCQLISDRVSNEINKALAFEEETKRARALEEIDRAKTIFFSNISHEFRTPLNLILSPLEELLHQPTGNLSTNEKQTLETTHRNAMRLLRLVNTLLDFSSIESGRQQTHFSRINIAKLTKNLVSYFESLIEKAGLKLIVNAQAIDQPVYVDKQMWEKIVFNLLSNAYKYTLEGSITVEIHPEKDQVVFRVKDTGVGIPQDELPKIFERFHRVQNAAGRTYEGTGIGLPLTKELVEMHQGTITAESELGKGSVFTVKIPIGKEHIAVNQINKTKTGSNGSDLTITMDEIDLLQNHSDTLSLEESPKDNDLPTVMIVDDSADMRTHLRSLLVKKFNITTAANGKDALKKIKDAAPDIVLTDIMMPVMDGITLLKELKSNKSTSNIPVILLTARAGEESLIVGFETAADDYLVKPFSSKELIARISAQIRTHQLRMEAQTQLQTIFRQTPVAISILNGMDFKYTMLNTAAQHLINRTEEEVIGKPLKEVFPELEAQGFLKIFRQVLTSGERFLANEKAVTLDFQNNGKPERRYINFSVDPITNTDGKVESIMIIAMDVSEQVEARVKIEESALRNSTLAAIVQSSEDAIISKSLDGIVTSWNPGAEKLFGFSADEIIGQPISKLIPPDRLYEEPEILRKIEQGKKVDHFQTKRLDKNGNLLHISLSISPIRNSEGIIIGAAKIARNITSEKVAEEKLKESEERFRMLVDNMMQLAWTCDELGNVTWYNKRWLDYTGMSFDDMQGWDWSKVHHPEHIQRVIDSVKKSAVTGEPWEDTFPLRGKDGKYRWFLSRAFPVRNQDGEIISWFGTNTDIEEQRNFAEKLEEKVKKRTRELSKQKDFIETIVNSTPDLVAAYDTEARIIAFNKACENALNIKREEVLGKIVTDAFPALKGSKSEKDLARALKGETIHNASYQSPVSNKYFENFISPLKDESGTIYGAVAIAHDITEVVKSTERIKQSEEKFNNLFHLSPLALSLLEFPSGTFIMVNEAFEELLGYSSDELIGRNSSELMLLDRKDREKIIAKLNETGSYKNIEATLKSKTKNEIPILASSQIIDIAGKKYYLNAITDITDRKKAEREIEIKSDFLEKMNKELESFTYISSHDLQEPLRKIQTFAGRIIEKEKDKLSETGKDYLKRMSSAATRMQTLLKDLLAFSRLNTTERKFESTRLNTLIDEVASDFKEAMDDDKATLEVGKMCEIKIIPFQIRQLFQNLISNSLKFAKPDQPPHITISSKTMPTPKSLSIAAKSVCHITYKDNGIGFEPQYSEKIFQVFQKLHGKDEFAGTGIGLAIVKKIVDIHHGHIHAESKLGMGASFHIYLPA